MVMETGVNNELAEVGVFVKRNRGSTQKPSLRIHFKTVEVWIVRSYKRKVIGVIGVGLTADIVSCEAERMAMRD